MPIIVKNSAISSSTNLSFNTNTINFLANAYEFSGSVNISESFNLSKNYYYSPREGSILITSSLVNNLKTGSLIYNKNINSLTFNTSNNTSSMSLGGLICCYQGNTSTSISSTNDHFDNILSSSYTNINNNFILNKKNYIFEKDFFEKGKELEIFLHFKNKKTNSNIGSNTNNDRICSLDSNFHKLYFIKQGTTSNSSSLFVSSETAADENNFTLNIFTNPILDDYVVHFFTDLKFKLLCTKKDATNVYFNVITEYFIYHNKVAFQEHFTNALYNSFYFKSDLFIPLSRFPGYFDFNLNIDTLLFFDDTTFNHVFSYFMVK